MARFAIRVGLITLLAAAAPAAAQAPRPVTITVRPEPRQRFAGLGTSLGNWGRDYQKLAPAERERLAGMLWRDLRMRSLRLWLNLDEYSPTPDARLTRDFRERYVDSGIIADAVRMGVVDLVLAPDGAPAAMKVPRPGGGPLDFAIKDESLDAYATLIAEFIAQIRAETGVLLNATGFQNEPNNLDRFRPDQVPRVVRTLRAALDARGLAPVRIVAPEAANVDGVCYETLDLLRADPAAWAAVSGIAWHTYNMGATARSADLLGTAGGGFKDGWMTESSDNGPEEPGDAARAAALASRFLGDVNHRATHWIHFLGFETPDPKDNATRILAYTANPLKITAFRKHETYRRLAAAFDVGCVFRRSDSTEDGDMSWTYGKKPRLSVAAAQNPDGSWAVALSNFTADAFRDDPGDNGGRPAARFAATVALPAAALADGLRFAVHRVSGRGAEHDRDEPEVRAEGGRIAVEVGPLDLVTLRSGPDPR